jgi:hypothetical protein
MRAFPEDIPNKVWLPVVERIGLPQVPIGFPADWFASHKSTIVAAKE